MCMVCINSAKRSPLWKEGEFLEYAHKKKRKAIQVMVSKWSRLNLLHIRQHPGYHSPIFIFKKKITPAQRLYLFGERNIFTLIRWLKVSAIDSFNTYETKNSAGNKYSFMLYYIFLLQNWKHSTCNFQRNNFLYFEKSRWLCFWCCWYYNYYP